MAKAQLHGLRNGSRIVEGDKTYVADTKSDDVWVYLNHEDGTPFFRQAKGDSGRRWGQSTMNPDREGHLVYALERYRDGVWQSYTDCAKQYEIKYMPAKKFLL